MPPRRTKRPGLSDEQDVARFIDRADKGLAGSDPRTQTAARSGNRDAQRAMGKRLEQNQRNSQDYAEDQAKAAQEAAEQAKKAREEATKQRRERMFREADAAGIETETDIASGDKVISRHPDGAPKFEAGEIGEPIQGAFEQREPGAGRNPMIPGSGAAAADGGTTETRAGQMRRDDRGNRRIDPVEPETDPETGEKFYETKDEFGKEGRTTVGQDLDVLARKQEEKREAEKAEKLEPIAQERDRIDARQAQIDLARERFRPDWEPVAESYDTARANWEEKSFKRGWGPVSQVTVDEHPKYKDMWQASDRQGNSEPVTKSEAAAIKQARKDARERFEDARKRYEELRPRHEALEAAARKAKLRDMELKARQLRIEAGVGEDLSQAVLDQAVAGESLEDDAPTPGQQDIDQWLRQSAEPEESEEPRMDPAMAQSPEEWEARTREKIAARGEPATPAENIGPRLTPGEGPVKPEEYGEKLLGTPIKTRLRRIGDTDGYLVDHLPKGKRNPQPLGRIDRTAGGVPYLEIHGSASRDLQILGASDPNPDLPTYLGQNPGRSRKEPAEAAAWAVETIEKVRRFGLSDSERLKAAKDAGATYRQIIDGVKAGELPVQTADALARELYGRGVKPDSNPLDPETFDKYAAENPIEDTRQKWKETAFTDSWNPLLSTAASALEGHKIPEARARQWENYVLDWTRENAGKPGVTLRDMRRLYETGHPDGPEGWAKFSENRKKFTSEVFNSAVVPIAGIAYGAIEHSAGDVLSGFGVEADWIERAGEEHKAAWDSAWFTGKGRPGGRAFIRNANQWMDVRGTGPGNRLDDALQSTRRELEDLYSGDEDPTENEVNQLLQRLVDPAIAAAEVGEQTDKSEYYAFFDAVEGKERGATHRELYDPTSNPELRSAVMNYVRTGNPAFWDEFENLLFMDAGQREHEKNKASLLAAAGDSKVHQAWIAGQMAPPEEALLEVATTVAGFGVAKVGMTGLKTASRFGRLARPANAMHRAMSNLGEFAMFTERINKPLGPLKRASNVAVTAAKPAVFGAVEEPIQEGIQAFGESPNLSGEELRETMTHAAALGAVGGPVMSWSLVGLQKVAQSGAQQTQDRQFAGWFNRTFKDQEGFRPITTQDAATARAFMPAMRDADGATVLPNLMIRRAEAMSRLRDLAPDVSELTTAERTELSTLAEQNRNPAQQKRFEDLRKRHQAGNAKLTPEQEAAMLAEFRDIETLNAEIGKVRDEMSQRVALSLEALESVRQAPDAAAKAYRTGMAKAAAGNFDQLTSAERQAVSSATTADGDAYFEDGPEGPVMTSAGRADLFEALPEIGAIAQTAGSRSWIATLAERDTRATEQADQAADREAGTGEQPSAEPSAEPQGSATGPTTPSGTSPGTTEGQTTPDAAPTPESRSSGQQPTPPPLPRDAGGNTQSAPPANDDPVPLAEGSPETAPRRVAEAVARRVRERTGVESNRIRIINRSSGTDGAWVNEEGIFISIPDIRESIRIANGDVQATADILANTAIGHELIHEAQTRVIKMLWELSGKKVTYDEFFTEFYGAMLGELSPEAVAAARELYGKGEDGKFNWDKIEPAQQTGELIRMLVEARKGDERFSEVYRAVRRGFPQRFIDFLREMVAELRAMLDGGNLPEAARRHVEDVEALYRDLSQPREETTAEAGETEQGGETEQTETAEAEATGETEKSSTQINLPEPLADRVREYARDIPEEDIYTAEEGFGREDEPHVTVLYGLTTETADEAREALAGTGPIKFTLGETSLFENENFDVLKIDVSSRALRSANKKLRDSVPFENNFPDYNPHVTVAYLKPGTGKKYAGDERFKGETVESSEVLFFGPDREKTAINTEATPEAEKQDSDAEDRAFVDRYRAEIEKASTEEDLRAIRERLDADPDRHPGVWGAVKEAIRQRREAIREEQREAEEAAERERIEALPRDQRLEALRDQLRRAQGIIARDTDSIRERERVESQDPEIQRLRAEIETVEANETPAGEQQTDSPDTGERQDAEQTTAESGQSEGQVAPEAESTAESAEPKPRRRRTFRAKSTVAEAFEQNETVARIIEQGGMMSRSRARKLRGKEWMKENRSLWDDAPRAANPTFNRIYNAKSEFAMMPDEMATAIGEGDVAAMWAEIGEAMDSATNIARQTAGEQTRQAEAERQLVAFEKASDGPEDGTPVEAGDLREGDTLVIDGEPAEVTAVEYDDIGDVQSVTLRDGRRFGRQTVDGDRVLYVEEHREGERGDDFLGDEAEAEATTPQPAPKPAPESELDRRNADNQELFADDGGFALRSEETADGDAVTRAREARERAAEEADAAQGRLFPEAETRTLGEIREGIAEEFGENSDLAAKARALEPESQKLPENQRQALAGAVEAEARRLRDGVLSAEEWQRLNPGATSPQEAVFQRFLDNQNAASVVPSFRKLLTPDAQTMLERVAAEAPEEFTAGRTTVTPTEETRAFPGDDGSPDVVGPALFAMRAYHGTPQRVDRFTTEKIGTGEGAQAYGYGLYFTDSAEVAEFYARMRADPADLDGYYTEQIEAWEEHLQRVPHDDLAQKQLDGIKARQAEAEKRRGNLYGVELKVEPEQLLDWDAPMSEQSEIVREAFAKLDVSAVYGYGAYDALARKLDDLDQGVPEWASEDLLKQGIRGIRYLDGNSRNRPLAEIKRDFLDALPEDAEFEDLDAAIEDGAFTPDQTAFLNALESDDWLGFDFPAQAISAALGERTGNFEMSDALRNSISDLRGDVSYNYVIFDESDIEITEENGTPVELPRTAEAGTMMASREGRSPETTPDLFEGLDELIAGPRRDLKRRAVEAARAAGENATARRNIARRVAAQEGVENPDLFAQAAAREASPEGPGAAAEEQPESRALAVPPKEGVTRQSLEEDLKAGERSGNYGLVTASKVRLAIVTGNPEIIDRTILEEMGINVRAMRAGNDVVLETSTDGHSFNHLLRAVRGAFDVGAAVSRDKRGAIRIFGATEQQNPEPSTPAIESPVVDVESTTDQDGSAPRLGSARQRQEEVEPAQLAEELLSVVGEDNLRVEQPRASYEDKRQLYFDFAESLLGGDQQSAAARTDNRGFTELQRIAYRLAEDVKRDLKVQFAGETIDGPAKLAELAQALRNPAFETFYLLALDADNKLLDTFAITSRLPATADLFEGKVAWDEGIVQHAEFLSNAGASRYMLLHNHPSGDPSPSRADRGLTKSHAESMAGRFEFAGHVVINHEKFSSIDAEGRPSLVNRLDGTVDTDLSLGRINEDVPDGDPFIVPGWSYNRALDNPEEVARVGRQLRDYHTEGLAPDEALVFTLDARLKLIGAYKAPLEQISKLKIEDAQAQGPIDGTHVLMVYMESTEQPDTRLGKFPRDVIDRFPSGLVHEVAVANPSTGEVFSAIESGILPPPKRFGWGETETSLGERVQEEPTALMTPRVVTPEQDAAYMEAVEAGDMDTAQRMVDEAARAAGLEKVEPTDFQDPDYIEPPNGIFKGREAHVENMARQFVKNGYEGRPVLLIGYNALTGSHRIHAARRANEIIQEEDLDVDPIEVPVFELSEDQAVEFDKWIQDSGDSIGIDYADYHRSSGDDYDKAADLRGAYDAGVIPLEFEALVRAEVLSNDGNDYGNFKGDVFANAEQIKSADPVTRDESGNVISLSERFDPASDSILHASRQRQEGPDLFDDAATAPETVDQAANAPDARERLGDVRVGTKHALNAYRTLTAKRRRTGALTATEEQTLLDAERALGQRLMFDMDRVRGTAPANPIRNTPATAPPPGAPARQEQIDLPGEEEAGGQMRLFSAAQRQVRDMTPEQIDAALSGLPGIFRRVFDAVQEGRSPEQVRGRFGLSQKAVGNILRAVEARLGTADQRGFAPATDRTPEQPGTAADQLIPEPETRLDEESIEAIANLEREVEQKLRRIEQQARERDDVVGAIRELEDMVRKLPLPVRGKYRGFASLSKLKTKRAQERYLRNAATRLRGIFADHLAQKNKEELRDILGPFATSYPPNMRKLAQRVGNEARDRLKVALQAAKRHRHSTAEAPAKPDWMEEAEFDDLVAQFDGVFARDADGVRVAEALEAAKAIESGGASKLMMFKLAERQRRAEITDRAVESILKGDPMDSPQQLRRREERRNRPVVKQVRAMWDFLYLGQLGLEQKMRALDEAGGEFMQRTFYDPVLEADQQAQTLTNDDLEVFSDSIWDALGVPNAGTGVRRLHDMKKIEQESGIWFSQGDDRGGYMEQPMSIMQAISLYNAMRDPSLEPTMESMQITDKTREKVEAFIGPDGVRFADVLSEGYRLKGQEVRDAFEATEGYKLDLVDNYGGRLYRVEVDAQATDQASIKFDSASGRATVKNGSLKARQDSVKALEFRDADVEFTKHVQEMNHYIGHSAIAKDLQQVLGADRVRRAMRQEKSGEFRRELGGHIEDILLGGQRMANLQDALGTLRGNLTRATLGLNLPTMFKQLTSFPAYATKMPSGRFVEYEAKFAAQPIKAAKEILAMPYIRNRMKGHYNRDINMQLQRMEGLGMTNLQSLNDKVMFMTRLGDVGAIIMGGWPLKRYTYDQAIKAGKTEQQATQEAERAFIKATEQAQQSSAIHAMGTHQRSGQLARLWTMYMTSPIQYNRNALGAVADAMKTARAQLKRRLDKKTAAKLYGEAFKTFAMFHVVLPQIFSAFSQGFVGFWSDDEEIREGFWKNQKRALVLGNFQSFFLLGGGLEFLASKAVGADSWFGPNYYNPLFDEGEKIIRGITTALSHEDDPELSAVENWWDKWERLVISGSKISGVPVDPVKRHVEGVVQVAKGEAEAPGFKLLGWSDWALGMNRSKVERMKSRFGEFKESFGNVTREDGSLDSAKQLNRDLELIQWIKDETAGLTAQEKEDFLESIEGNTTKFVRKFVW